MNKRDYWNEEEKTERHLMLALFVPLITDKLK